jgi:hypothetical protein
MSGEKRKAPTKEEIELRAYQIYLERGCEDGYDVTDWFVAEEQLTAETESAVPALPTSDSTRTGARKSQHPNTAEHFAGTFSA